MGSTSGRHSHRTPWRRRGTSFGSIFVPSSTPDVAGMRVHLYTRSWNDAVMLPFFFRHYDPIVDRYVVFDDGSTDDSLRLLQSHPKVDLRRLPLYLDPDSRVISASTFFDQCWKESSGHADWV